MGRFLSVDPLAKGYPMLTPYQFASNTPITAIDLDGLELLLVNEKNDPKIVKGGKKITDESAIHIVAHGWQRGIVDDSDGKYKRITTGSQFVPILRKSNKYAEMQKAENVCVILHSCRTGRSIKNKQGKTLAPSFAEKVSEDLDITVIAPDERDYISENGEIGPQVTANTEPINREYTEGLEQGKKSISTGEVANWLIYKGGVLVGVYCGHWTPKANPGWWDNLRYKKDLNYIVKSAQLNLREEASSNSKKLGEALKLGDSLIPLGNVKKRWVEVQTKDGRKGWVHSKYINAKYEESNQ